jgi:CheY-like chemotaxis protein
VSGEQPTAFQEPKASGVLVVDDDDAIRESLTLLLEDEGYRVDSAANGREALAVLERVVLPAVALVDLRMPVMDGVQLIEALRCDSRYARMPVIAFSAASTVAPPAGVPVLRKPIGIEQLLTAIRAAICGARHR